MKANIPALDVASDTAGHAHELLAKGIKAVGFYARTDRASKAMLDGLHSVGIKLFTIWEAGNPTHSEYFTDDRGTYDGKHAVAFAQVMGQPEGTPIFAAIDYDSDPADVAAYVEAIHTEVRAAGYLLGLYGNGLTLGHFQDAGYSHYGYLSQSKGFQGYEDYLPRAAIVQGKETLLCGFDVDLDTVMDPAVLW